MYTEAALMYSPSNLESISFGLLGRYRYNNLDRAFFRCEQCPPEDLDDFDSSLYDKAFIEYQFTSDIHIQLNYTHFISDTGFDNSVGVQVSFIAF